MGKSLRFFDCILVSMPGLDGVLPIARTTCCSSLDSTKSMNNFAALLCGPLRQPLSGATRHLPTQRKKIIAGAQSEEEK